MATEADAVVAIEACTVQLGRTAAWLRSLPLVRFSQADGAVEQQARELIAQVHRCSAGMCAGLRASSDSTAADAVHCPPPDREPDHLGVHGLGDQLAVHAAELERCARVCVAAGIAVNGGELETLAASALRLRSDN